MLKNLFISKVRIRILEKYMLEYKPAYHVRGLVRELGEEINAVRRELLNLKTAGILKSASEGNKLVYKLDSTSPMLGELRAMFFKDSSVGQLLYSKLSTLEGIEAALVTETFLKGKYTDDTDLDILFIGDMKLRDLTTIMSSIEKEIGRDIKFAALKKDAYEFGKKKKDPILMNNLAKNNILLIGNISDLA